MIMDIVSLQSMTQKFLDKNHYDNTASFSVFMLLIAHKKTINKFNILIIVCHGGWRDRCTYKCQNTLSCPEIYYIVYTHTKFDLINRCMIIVSKRLQYSWITWGALWLIVMIVSCDDELLQWWIIHTQFPQ